MERIQVLFYFNKDSNQLDVLSCHLLELFPQVHKTESIPLLKKLKMNQELILIERTLQEVDGNLDLAAKKLGMSRKTLWREMKLLDNSISNLK